MTEPEPPAIGCIAVIVGVVTEAVVSHHWLSRMPHELPARVTCTVSGSPWLAIVGVAVSACRFTATVLVASVYEVVSSVKLVPLAETFWPLA